MAHITAVLCRPASKCCVSECASCGCRSFPCLLGACLYRLALEGAALNGNLPHAMPEVYSRLHALNNALLVHICSGVSVEGTSSSLSWQDGGGLFDHLCRLCTACQLVHSCCLHTARMWCAAKTMGQSAVLLLLR